MRFCEIFEAVGRITKQNQTHDVGPNEIKTQAAKFGNTVDKDGRPPTLSKKVKGKSTNVLYNLGLSESVISELNIAKTLDFIKQAHGDQLYGNFPYWTHPRAVALTGRKIFKNKFNSDAVKTAFLHDVVEDTNVSLDELRKLEFSDQVVNAVDLLTKDRSLSYADNIEKIIASGNPLAMMVKYADNYENFTGDKSDWDSEKAAASQKKYLKSLDRLGDVLGVNYHLSEDIGIHRTSKDFAVIDLSKSADGTFWLNDINNTDWDSTVTTGKGVDMAFEISPQAKLASYDDIDKHSTDELEAMDYDGVRMVDGPNTTYQIWNTDILKRIPLSKKGISEFKESLRVDVPSEEWLNTKIRTAKENGRDKHGAPYMGTTTAYIKDNIKLPVDLLKQLPGKRGEQKNVRKKDLEKIMQIMQDTGKLPLLDSGEEYAPFIQVAWNGEAWVSEGNHRIMAAAELGWKELPVELRYYDGGERIKSGPLHPGKIGI